MRGLRQERGRESGKLKDALAARVDGARAYEVESILHRDFWRTAASSPLRLVWTVR